MERFDLIQLLHFFADGKLDALDMRILRTQSERASIGALAMSKMLHISKRTIQVRIKKIHKLCSQSQMALNIASIPSLNPIK